MRTLVDIAVLILAAGRSSRMGTPKQLLSWKQTTLLGHVIETAKKSLASGVFVVLGAHFGKIRPIIPEGEITVIENPNWEQGLGTSIAKGVQYLLGTDGTYQGILVLLCDQPLIDSIHLNRMIEAFRANDKGMVATAYGSNPGVPAIFGKAYFDALKGLKGDQGAKTVLMRNSSDCISLVADGLVPDIDTVDDYNRLFKD